MFVDLFQRVCRERQTAALSALFISQAATQHRPRPLTGMVDAVRWFHRDRRPQCLAGKRDAARDLVSVLMEIDAKG